MDIYLASTSPRRRQLMSEILTDFIQCSPETQEKEYPRLTPVQKAVRRCKDKCIAAVNHIKDYESVIIASDTVVDFHGRTLDKPVDRDDAFRMISDLSGNFHYVHTAVSVYYEGSVFTFCDTTEVHFRHIPQDVISEYVKENTAYDKRGGYGIQTEFGQKYIDRIEGDYYTVVGLPVERLKKLLIFLNIL
ncbi:MAG: septum formation protein Maf [Oscillospiraceae bacterium]|nr:septum formation protein Maf [Oscillospiraceae bacterium]